MRLVGGSRCFVYYKELLTAAASAEAHSAPEAGGGRAFKAGEAVMEIARTFGVDRATIYSPE
jgi:hypothetical protein